ncbi:MAG: hypothetical protein ITG04_10725 [Proteiniphilum sp.]|nr:hypothetical protein [Proteiniphilum sp.]
MTSDWKRCCRLPHQGYWVIAGDLLDEWFVPAPIDTYQGKVELVHYIGLHPKTGKFKTIRPYRWE